MKEIGGYIELDTYLLPMLHEEAVALNCGRNALAYLLRARKIKKLWIPRFICDSVTGVCEREGVLYELYSVGTDFRPSEDIRPGDGEWLYLVNYYSQLDNRQIAVYVKKFPRIIVDNAQSYFQPPLPHVDTLYTCRKYFGVADGAFLYTDTVLADDWPRDESHDRMRFLLGRYERTASEFYGEYTANNRLFANEPIKRMSALTENLLHGIDYEYVKKRRETNFAYLHTQLEGVNRLKPKPSSFMYPFFTENGMVLRKKLQAEKIYIPTLWPSVFDYSSRGSTEYGMAENILPLPIDQRYTIEDMKHMLEVIKCLNN